MGRNQSRGQGVGMDTFQDGEGSEVVKSSKGEVDLRVS